MTKLQRWTYPQDYFGDTWYDYFRAGVGQHRDSDCLERSNFDAMLLLLGGETDTVLIVRENHWAVGWIEWIAIHESNTEAQDIASKALSDLENYPVLDESLYSEYENNECIEIWSHCFDPKERAKYLREHCYDLVNCFRQLLAACKGSWDDAANLLPCPSDLIQ